VRREVLDTMTSCDLLLLSLPPVVEKSVSCEGVRFSDVESVRLSEPRAVEPGVNYLFSTLASLPAHKNAALAPVQSTPSDFPQPHTFGYQHSTNLGTPVPLIWCRCATNAGMSSTQMDHSRPRALPAACTDAPKCVGTLRMSDVHLLD
jgi:hypothetical protein